MLRRAGTVAVRENLDVRRPLAMCLRDREVELSRFIETSVGVFNR